MCIRDRAKSEIEYTKAVYGEPTVTHLHRLGVLDKNLLAVHTVWLTNEEVDLFKKYDVKVSHNPASAMRVLGFAKIPQMLDKKICVSIGTDGASSSNRMDMVDAVSYTHLNERNCRMKKHFENLKVGKKLIVAFASIVVLYVITVSAAVVNIRSLSDRIEKLYTEPFANMEASMEMIADMQSIGRNLLILSTTDNAVDRAQYLKRTKEYAACLLYTSRCV